MLCDRGLIQVTVDDEGNQACRARYWIQKLNARQLEVELPTAAMDCLVNVWLDQKRITNWTPLEGEPTKARIPIRPKLYQQPCLLEMEYKLPASFASSGSSWRTTLYAPLALRARQCWEPFAGIVGLLAASLVVPAIAAAPNPEYHWVIEGGLLEPHAMLTTAEYGFASATPTPPPCPSA